jgi:hypothetical protein
MAKGNEMPPFIEPGANIVVTGADGSIVRRAGG